MKIFTMLMLMFTLSFSVFAAKESKEVIDGKNFYLTNLRAKFNDVNGKDFAGKRLQIEWKRFFKDSGKKFIEQYSKDYPNAKEYLGSADFTKNLSALEAFTMFYAADSGNDLGGCK